MASRPQSIGPFTVRIPAITQPRDLADLQRQVVAAQQSLLQQVNTILASLVTGVDSTAGFRGTVILHDQVDTLGNPVTIGPATQGTHAVQKQQVVTRDDASQQWEAQTLRLTHLADGIDQTDAVTLGQLQEMLKNILAGLGTVYVYDGALSLTPVAGTQAVVAR